MTNVRWLWMLGFLWVSCANPVPPTGGEKDTRGPRLVYAQPDTFATQVQLPKIYLRFDEWVELKNIQAELLVSPPQSRPPLTRIVGKGVEVIFQDSLRPSTTYQLQFGKAIVDFTEGNPAAGFQYIFSTGEALDSGTVLVKVMEAATGLPAAGIKVMLHSGTADSLVRTRRPDYAMFTNDKGEAKLAYLRKGTYRLYALRETGGDYLYNGPGESIGFLSEPVLADSGRHILRIFSEPPLRNKAMSVRNAYPGKAWVRFAGPADSLQLSFFPQPLAYEWGKDRPDSLVIWFGRNPPDSLKIELTWPHGKDTLKLIPSKWQAPRTGGGAGRNTGSASAVSESPFALKRLPLDPPPMPGDPIRIWFDHPLEKLDTGKFFFMGKPIQPAIDTLRPRCLVFPGILDAGSTYWMTWQDSALFDVFGNVAPRDSIRFALPDPEDAVEVHLDVFAPSTFWTGEPYMMGLTGNQKLPSSEWQPRDIDSLGTGRRFTFRLFPGKYDFVLWQDMNGNKRWDTGSFARKEQPEPLIRLEKTIEVRAGFSVQQIWNLNPAAATGPNRGRARE
jgi:hypothetical protein